MEIHIGYINKIQLKLLMGFEAVYINKNDVRVSVKIYLIIVKSKLDKPSTSCIHKRRY